MSPAFRLFPYRASTSAAAVDHLSWYLTAYTLFFTLLILVLIVYFALRYRRRSEAPPPFTPSNYWLEIIWSVIPFSLALIMFVWGAKIYIDQSHAPPDAMEIDVVGKQWMWKIQHATGRREIDELHVPVGRDVVLKMTTEDVIHSFFIPAFRIKQDVVPGRYTYEWFHATVPGEYHLFCAEYCGANHASMVGRVIVMEPAKYQQWLQATPADVPPAQAGEKLFQQYGCMACHGQQGPTLAGVYNSRVRLSNGQIVTADDNYLRQSILNPSAQIVDGFAPIMPTFKGQISEEQIMQIIAYIKSLQADQQPGADRTSGGAQDIFGVPTGVRPPDQGGTTPPAPATLPRSPNTPDHSR